MGFTLNLLDTRKPTPPSTSRVTWMVIKGRVRGKYIRNRIGCVMRAKLSLSEGENIQFHRYYHVCDSA